MPTGLFDLLSIQGVTFPSTNISSEATAGFEVKNDRNTAYIHITEATFDTDAYLSLALGGGSKAVSAAQAKTLPGVTAGEAITVYAELYALSLDAGQSGGMEIEFFDEDGEQQGDTTTLAISTAGEWEQKRQRITVPEGATRMNMYVHAGCGAEQTAQTWIAHLKIAR